MTTRLLIASLRLLLLLLRGCALLFLWLPCCGSFCKLCFGIVRRKTLLLFWARQTWPRATAGVAQKAGAAAGRREPIQAHPRSPSATSVLASSRDGRAPGAVEGELGSSSSNLGAQGCSGFNDGAETEESESAKGSQSLAVVVAPSFGKSG